WLRFFGCGLLGIGTSVALLYVVQYYTEARFRPARELAESARGGAPFVVLGGLSTGLESTLAPLGLVLIVAFVSFRLGWRTGHALSSVGRAARRVLEEARRTHRLGPGDARRPTPRTQPKENDDRETTSGVGEAAARAALRELLLPAAIVPIVPVAVGLGLRWM